MVLDWSIATLEAKTISKFNTEPVNVGQENKDNFRHLMVKKKIFHVSVLRKLPQKCSTRPRIRKLKLSHKIKAMEVLEWFLQNNCVAGAKLNQSGLKQEDRGIDVHLQEGLGRNSKHKHEEPGK